MLIRRRLSSNLQYRPDIDGLRAVAVLAVVAYHAFPALAPGGYVGVDVFFVISGYLISGLIIEDARNGTFRYPHFYARRIKRIFPALILVLSTCMAIGWFCFLPDEFRMLGSHVFAGAGFWINFTYYREAGYFDVQAIYKSLLHLWSLAIEEQFYLLWPPVIGLAVLLRLRIVTVAVVTILASLAACLILTRSNPGSAFYLPWSRAWELLCGACLACAPTVPGDADRTNPSRIASGLGVALVLIPVFAFGSKDPFPGWRAMLPVAGTSLLIAAGSQTWINRTILSHPAAVSIGLMSYPLYLWHWPAISIPEIVGASSPSVRIGGILVSFALAWATYRIVERPIRRSPSSTAIWLLLAIITIGAIGLAAKRSIILARSHSPELLDILAAKADWLSPSEAGTAVTYDGATFWKDGSNREEALIIGDSNAEQYFVRTHELVRTGRAGLSPVFAASGACLPIPSVAPTETPSCEDFILKAFEYAKAANVRTVAVAAQWIYAQSPDRFHLRTDDRLLALSGSQGRTAAFDKLRDQLLELRKLGKRTIVISSIPAGDEFAPAARIERTFAGIHLVPARQPTRQEAMAPQVEVLDQLARAARESGSEMIDPALYLCAPRCISADENGAPIYKDSTHFRASFTREHATFIDDILALTADLKRRTSPWHRR